MITDEVDEEPEEDEPQRIEEQKPEVIKEELLNTTKAAEILVVPDEEVKEEIKSQDDLKDDDRAMAPSTRTVVSTTSSTHRSTKTW